MKDETITMTKNIQIELSLTECTDVGPREGHRHVGALALGRLISHGPKLGRAPQSFCPPAVFMIG